MSELKTSAEAARELLYKKKTVYERRDEAAVEAAYDYAVGYAKYLDDAKTEREAVWAAIKLAEASAGVLISLIVFIILS